MCICVCSLGFLDLFRSTINCQNLLDKFSVKTLKFFSLFFYSWISSPVLCLVYIKYERKPPDFTLFVLSENWFSISRCLVTAIQCARFKKKKRFLLDRHKD